MKKLLFVAVLVLAACGNKTGRTVNDADSLRTDTLTDAISEKHTAAYISQRVDSMYSRYKNATRNQFGLVIDHTVNYDSMFCSTRYQNLKSQALALAEDDLLLDYDHWTNSQDDGDFSYQIEKIENITDSTMRSFSVCSSSGVTGMSMISCRLLTGKERKHTSRPISMSGLGLLETKKKTKRFFGFLLT